MKIIDGKLKLDKRDTRVGNFVITNESDYYKVQDINNMISHRFNKKSLIGRALPVMMQEGYEKFLTTWISVSYLAFSVVPDSTFLSDLLNASNACIERHREDFYNSKAVTDEDDKKVLEEQKKLHEDYMKAKEELAQSAE